MIRFFQRLSHLRLISFVGRRRDRHSPTNTLGSLICSPTAQSDHQRLAGGSGVSGLNRRTIFRRALVGRPDHSFRSSFLQLPQKSRLVSSAVVFPVPDDRQDCTFPRKRCLGGSLSLIFRLSCAGQARFGGNSSTSISDDIISIFMAHKLNTKTARLDLDITPEAQRRFASLHEALGFKTKTETFEALVFSVAAKDVVSPNLMDQINAKLDHTLEILESLT